jgi:hypothetical protein
VVLDEEREASGEVHHPVQFIQVLLPVARSVSYPFSTHFGDGWSTYPFFLDMSLQNTPRQEAGDFGDLGDILISVVAHQKKDEDIAVCAEAGIALSRVRHEVLGGLVRLDKAVDTDAVTLLEVI